MKDLRDIPQPVIDYVKSIQTQFDVELETLEARLVERIEDLEKRLKELEG